MHTRGAGRRYGGSTTRHTSALMARALHSPSQELDDRSRASLGASLRHDLGHLRIHEGPDARAATQHLGARAFTYGRHIVLGSRASATLPHARRSVLAHEAVHAIQQRSAADPGGPARVLQDPAAEGEARKASAVAADPRRSGEHVPVGVQMAPSIQCDVEDPGRLAGTHRSLFVSAPGGGGGALRTWQDARGSDRGTAGVIFDQAKQAVRDLVTANPASVGGTVPTLTTESELDADALAMDARLRARFPIVAAPATPEAITDAVSVLGPAITSGVDYRREWLANKLIEWTDIEQFSIAETDTRFVALLDSLFADTDIGGHLRTLATRIGGFQTGEGTSRQIFVHRGSSEAIRRTTLIHELVHFHSHPRFRDWVDGTTEPRFFSEGFTEWLAQRVMTTDERTSRGVYADRVDAIQRQVAAHVPEDDIVRAYFAGEVWRIETRSTIARREFAATSGIAEAATRRQEEAASRTGPGINEEVAAGAHYRFLNLGHDRADPKPEHISLFRGVKIRFLDPEPAAQVRFVGHASTPGPADYNRDLSRRRALAFYRMARSEGLPDSRLIGARRPEHFGERRPTLTEGDAQTRAFNRRVEMFVTVTPAAAPRTTDDAATP